ncbi:DNA-3-methyladenine glycosylase [Infirmifilum lucidum]|uniref:Putative 3-methyladenine DNA glycosylase n=1 Tax=Infirmifilum lucidum TaxID=2776706 RepID=A0A7L9FK87_9CREN|nr:DNA-3-methyladenine glycosylase [Infirmifilum lucidum]
MPQSFYARRPDVVAAELLGKLLVRVIDSNRIAGVIVETEAYFGPEDPASRARHRKGDLAETMRGPVGYTLIYGVHRQWLLNIVAHEEGEYGAVLIRSIKVSDTVVEGPGRLTRYLLVDKKLHKKPVYDPSSGLCILDFRTAGPDCIERRKRVGVRRDLDVPLNFSIRSECYPVFSTHFP